MRRATLFSQQPPNDPSLKRGNWNQPGWHVQDQTRRFLCQRRPPPGSAASRSSTHNRRAPLSVDQEEEEWEWEEIERLLRMEEEEKEEKEEVGEGDDKNIVA